MAVPILAGPGTISSDLSFTATDSAPSHVVVVEGVFAFICLLTYQLSSTPRRSRPC
ncbi:MAG TPA: hypothetical protein HA349_08360 [Methanotrichaceae archaeon]|nr:hypothetical protein [Methanotrichaceae archaeon]